MPPSYPSFNDRESNDATSASSFVCASRNDGEAATWIDVSGELDAATSPQLAQALGEADRDARLVVLDLRELAFIDAGGIRVIVDASLTARHGEGRVILVGTPARARDLFELTGATADLDIVELDLDPVSAGRTALPQHSRPNAGAGAGEDAGKPRATHRTAAPRPLRWGEA